MRPLLAILLVAIALPAVAQEPQPLAVVFIDVAGAEPWTTERQAAAIADAEDALAWLGARGLEPPVNIEVLPPLALAPIDLAGWDWLRDSPERVTLYVINNAGLPGLRLGPGGWSGAYVPPDRVLVLAETSTPRPAVIAHEMTHLLTGLADWPAEACYRQMDILCRPPQVAAAYEFGTLGCLTLAGLGTPCQITYYPEVWQ